MSLNLSKISKWLLGTLKFDRCRNPTASPTESSIWDQETGSTLKSLRFNYNRSASSRPSLCRPAHLQVGAVFMPLSSLQLCWAVALSPTHQNRTELLISTEDGEQDDVAPDLQELTV